VARYGWLLLPEYRFNVTTGLWRHRAGVVEPPLRLSQLSYDAHGVLRWPTRHERASESALADHLTFARDLFAARAAQPQPSGDAAGPAGRVSAGFEELRWFELPEVCLT
jgi:hypothetical protein